MTFHRFTILALALLLLGCRAPQPVTPPMPPMPQAALSPTQTFTLRWDSWTPGLAYNAAQTRETLNIVAAWTEDLRTWQDVLEVPADTIAAQVTVPRRTFGAFRLGYKIVPH